MHAVINNSIIEVFNFKKLQKAFPEIDEFTLKDLGRMENGKAADVES